jgi:hypothetical protein
MLDFSPPKAYLCKGGLQTIKFSRMKELIHIRTECYSGYREDETPKCFMWQGTRHEVKEIIDRWYQWDNEQKRPLPANSISSNMNSTITHGTCANRVASQSGNFRFYLQYIYRGEKIFLNLSYCWLWQQD